MCGIAGLMTIDGKLPDRTLLDSLAVSVAHRGPDGQGRFITEGLGLIQTRLAIIDLERGDQPFFVNQPSGVGESTNKRAVLVANGEIYNYVELRAAMRDVAFATESDCEVPLHLYLRHGLAYADQLRGMYAIAIYDSARRRLVLSRDPFGIKPLYYAETASGFAFASEPRALVTAGIVSPVVIPVVRDEMLQLQFTTGMQTIFDGIQRVLPGETLAIEGGRIVERRFVAALPSGGTDDTDKEQALISLDKALMDSVNVHQRSDVPYAMFLSGGIDSSALLAMMHRLNPRPICAFTAGFPGTRVHDERGHAKAVAAAVGADYHEVQVTEADFWKRLPLVAGAMDDPAADYAALPTFLLAERARAEGYKVVLTGEGGDELFGGYSRYRTFAPRGALAVFGRRMRSRGLMQRARVLREGGAAWRVGFAESEREAEQQSERTRLQVAQAIDCVDWLPNNLMIKADRCLMANGVEGRVPFLDPALANFAYRLPDRLKLSKGSGKWLLRYWLDKYLPASRPFAPKKGFTVPVGEWIASEGKRLGALVAAQPGVAEACVPARVEQLFHAPATSMANAKWNLLFYALWHQHNILGRHTEGDVFESLSA
jgi:asparagine synthase (glutamine-hydrolysing)